MADSQSRRPAILKKTHFGWKSSPAELRYSDFSGVDLKKTAFLAEKCGFFQIKPSTTA